MVKLNILNMKNFLDTVNACIGKVYMLKDTGQFVATILKTKLSVSYFRNSESNGLYEHCFVLCRGLLICLQIFHYKGPGVLFFGPALLKGVKNGIEHSNRRTGIKGSVRIQSRSMAILSRL